MRSKYYTISRRSHPRLRSMGTYIALGTLFTVFLSTLLPIVALPASTATTPNKDNTNSPSNAYSTLNNQTVSDNGAGVWVTGTANGSKTFNGVSIGPTYNMPIPAATAGWQMDHATVAISSMQDSLDYLAAPLGTFDTSTLWTSVPATGINANWESDNSGMNLVSSSIAGAQAQQFVQSNYQQVNVGAAGDPLVGHAIEQTSGNTWSCVNTGSYFTPSLSYQMSDTTTAQTGCWNCQCSGTSHGPYAGATSTHVHLASPTTVSDLGGSYGISEVYNTVAQPGLPGGSQNTREYSYSQTSYGYCYTDSTSQGCGTASSAAYFAFQNQGVRTYTDTTATQNFNFAGHLTSAALSGNLRWSPSFGATSSNRWYSIAIQFKITKPDSTTYSLAPAINIAWNNYGGYSPNANDPFSLDMSSILGMSGVYYVQAIVTLTIYQQDSQSASGSTSAYTAVDNWADNIRVDMWGLGISYIGIFNEPCTPAVSYNYMNTVSPISLGARQLAGVDPTLTGQVYFTQMTMDPTSEAFSGAYVACYVTNTATGKTMNWTSTDTSLRFDTLLAAASGWRGFSLALPGFCTFLGSSPSFSIGLGILITGPFRIKTTHDFWWYWDTLGLSIKGTPMATQDSLNWETAITDSPGQSYYSLPVTNNGYGGGVASIDLTHLHRDGSNDYQIMTFGTPGVTNLQTLTFSFTCSMFLKLNDVSGTRTTTYTATSSDTITFKLDTQVTIPHADTGQLLPGNDYNATLMQNITIPGYQLGGVGSPWYWQFVNATDPQVVMAPLSYSYYPNAWNPSGQAWIYTHDNYSAIPNNQQVLQFGYQAYSQQLASPIYTNVHWIMYFTAPNDVASASNMVISRNPNLTTADTTYYVGTNLYMNATYRTDARTILPNTQKMSAVLLNYTGTLLQQIGGVDNPVGGVPWGLTYNATFPLSSGKGSGYGVMFIYNMTGTMMGASGVYRVGFRVMFISIVRPTVAILTVTIGGVPTTANNRIYNCDNGSYNSTPIIISVDWYDAVNGPIGGHINSSDSVPVSVNITVDNWVAFGTYGYKTAIPNNNPTSGTGYNWPFGWTNLPLIDSGNNYGSSAGENYTCYADPMSEWRDLGSNYGNISQGFHNFTITLSKPGYDTLTITDNFSIVVQSYLSVTTPARTSTAPNTGQWPSSGEAGAPHYMGTGAYAGSNFSFVADLYERTPDELGGVPTMDNPITNQTNNFYYGQMTLNYSLYEMLDSSGAAPQWSNITNWSYCLANNGQWNYNNGSFYGSGGPDFYAQFLLPTYAENSYGYGTTAPIDPQYVKVLFYNVTYSIATNMTMGAVPGQPGYFYPGFQPNIVDNSTSPGSYSSVNATSPYYNPSVSYPVGAALNEGKIHECVVLVLLNKELSANRTVMWMNITNDSDCGYAFSMVPPNNQQFPNLQDASNPQPGVYQVLAYYLNGTQYGVDPATGQALPTVTNPCGNVYTSDTGKANRTDMIRFRVYINSTYTQSQSHNPFVPPCGPINQSLDAQESSWSSQVRLIQLLNWNSSGPINLQPDNACNWSLSFNAYTPLSGGSTVPITMTGSEWVTPWLNVTQHGACSYSSLTGMPYIVAYKDGYDPCQAYINLTIMPDVANGTIVTNMAQQVIGTGNGATNPTYALAQVPIGTYTSFNFTYSDVTNTNPTHVPWASNQTTPVTGAIMSFITGTAGLVGIYANNRTNSGQQGTWWYYEYPNQPGTYNVTIWVPEDSNIAIGSADNNATVYLTFGINTPLNGFGLSNFEAKQLNIQLNVTRRTVVMTLVTNAPGYPIADSVAFASCEIYSPSNPGNLITLVYDIYDTNLGQYVTLSNPTQSFTFNKFWTWLSYGAGFYVQTVTVPTPYPHPGYVLQFWPSAYPLSNVSSPIVGTYNLQANLSAVTNVFATSATHQVIINPGLTNFNLLANDTSAQFVDPVLAASGQIIDKAYMAQFQFQLQDLNFPGGSWPEIYPTNTTAQPPYDGITGVTTSWVSPWNSQWVVGPTNSTVTNGTGFYLAPPTAGTYTIYFNIVNMSASATPYLVNVWINKTNFVNVSTTLAFYVVNASTYFKFVTINGIDATTGPTTKTLWYGDTMSIHFKWGASGQDYNLAGQTAYFIGNDSSTFPSDTNNDYADTTLSITNYQDPYIVYPGPANGRPVGQFAVADASGFYGSGEYEINLTTAFAFVQPTDLPYTFSFTVVLSKPNFVLESYTFTIQLRAVATNVQLFAPTGPDTLDYTPLTQQQIQSQVVIYGNRYDLYLELVQAESPGATDIYHAKSNSTGNVAVNNTQAGGEDYWYINGTYRAGDYNVQLHHDSTPAGEFYYYRVSMNTTRLNASEFPDGLVLTFVLTSNYYAPQTVQVTLFILPRGYTHSNLTQNNDPTPYTTSFSIVEGQIIDPATQTSFTLTIQLVYNHTAVADDEFTVFYYLTYPLDKTTNEYPKLTGAGCNGSLTWNGTVYVIVVKINPTSMHGPVYVDFIITCTTGNYANIITEPNEYSIVFKEVVVQVELWPLILAFVLIGIVASYVGYKAFQLRIPLVLRLIAETIDKIQKDKYPGETGVLVGRNEYVVNTLLDRLDQVGIQWEKAEKYVVEDAKAKAGAEKELPPMNLPEINAALDGIAELTVEEKAIFADELKRLGRKEQDEFISSLKHEGNA